MQNLRLWWRLFLATLCCAGISTDVFGCNTCYLFCHWLTTGKQTEDQIQTNSRFQFHPSELLTLQFWVEEDRDSPAILAWLQSQQHLIRHTYWLFSFCFTQGVGGHVYQLWWQWPWTWMCFEVLICFAAVDVGGGTGCFPRKGIRIHTNGCNLSYCIMHPGKQLRLTPVKSFFVWKERERPGQVQFTLFDAY